MTTEFIGNNGSRYGLIKELGSGGQGYVYKVKCLNSGIERALKWYHSTTSTQEQKERLNKLIQEGTPVSGVDGIEFIWPLELVTHPDSPGFGYVMPLIDTRQYVELNSIIIGKKKQPSQKKLCRLSSLLCVAMESVHQKGMAYCDINLGNIMFDPDNAKMIICDNDNVVVNNADVAILGVLEFMAPEVALNESLPNAQSDLYSIAILLYQLWMWEHPMDGKITFEKAVCWDIPSKLKRFAREPLFVHHPTDNSNSAQGIPMLELSLKRWGICPPVLKQAFTKVFTEGIKNKEKRLRLSDWQRIFLELESDAVTCPCGAGNLIDISSSVRTCFHCRSSLEPVLILNSKFPGGTSHLVVHTNGELRRHHVEYSPSNREALDVIGIIKEHPQKKGVHGIGNNSRDTWYYQHNGQTFPIEPGQARPLIPGATIKIGQSTLTVDCLPE
ncbi:MAG: protein kinase [Desulfamplus sp.]|nr:protein kinase [Desulfamplus sp.]